MVWPPPPPPPPSHHNHMYVKIPSSVSPCYDNSNNNNDRKCINQNAAATISARAIQLLGYECNEGGVVVLMGGGCRPAHCKARTAFVASCLELPPQRPPSQRQPARLHLQARAAKFPQTTESIRVLCRWRFERRLHNTK